LLTLTVFLSSLPTESLSPRPSAALHWLTEIRRADRVVRLRVYKVTARTPAICRWLGQRLAHVCRCSEDIFWRCFHL